MSGGSSFELPEGYEPASTRRNWPGRHRWSMPLMPYMSPAAIGCSVVRFAGEPVSSYRSPIAFSTASGQPSPDEDETVMTAESSIRWAASAALSTGTVRMLLWILQSIQSSDLGTWTAAG